ncbi:MAG: heme A synthase [Cyanobium sp. PLM2.Bin73]|nr:MAG: heme A synthase [Cyanobium sp. PLM2.Bin73]
MSASPHPARQPPSHHPALAEPPSARFELLTSHLVVALVALVVIGGATRVMQAGLACPDWPLCYGQWLPGGRMNLQVFLEWFHRLDAFVVGVALLVLSAASWVGRRRLPAWLPWSAGAALLLVAVQGALGALTVTQLLAPGLVTAHLGTALLLVALLSGVHQALERERQQAPVALPQTALPLWWRALSLLALVMVLGQCLLGGSLASQWAAERCLAAAEGCQWLLRHRLAATPAALAVILLVPAALVLPARERHLRAFAALAALLVVAQVALGVSTLRLQLAVPAVTVAHQFTAALLVALLGAVAGRSLAPGPQVQNPAAAFPTSVDSAHG